MTSRAWTAEEARARMLAHLKGIAQYWGDVKGRTDRERLDGLCFSFLTMIDGSNVELPSMDLVLRPHPDDKAFAEANDENYYEDGMVINDAMLHEEWHK